MKLSESSIVLLISILSIFACSGKKAEEEAPAQKAVVPVKIAHVRMSNIDETISATGQTEALRKENIVSPVAGRIERIDIQEGSKVRKGDTLAVILTKESISTLEGAEALIERAKTPQQKMEAERAMELARSSQNHVIIRSHISGVVAGRYAAEGAVVAEGEELLSLIDQNSINFVAHVPLKELSRIANGQTARISFASVPESIFAGAVNAINPQADTGNQTVRVLLHIKNIEGNPLPFQNGMAGTAKIIIGHHQSITTVPLAAVLRNDENNTFSIVTVTADSLSKTIQVTPGISQDSIMEISSPELREGTPVIVEGHYALPDSTRVTIRAQEQK